MRDALAEQATLSNRAGQEISERATEAGRIMTGHAEELSAAIEEIASLADELQSN